MRASRTRYARKRSRERPCVSLSSVISWKRNVNSPDRIPSYHGLGSVCESCLGARIHCLHFTTPTPFRLGAGGVCNESRSLHAARVPGNAGVKWLPSWEGDPMQSTPVSPYPRMTEGLAVFKRAFALALLVLVTSAGTVGTSVPGQPRLT